MVFFYIMDLNHIILTPSLISELYFDSLTEAIKTNKQKEIKTTSDIPWEYIGKNEKKILFLVRYVNKKELPEQQRLFLNKMLAACKLSFSDIVLLNTGINPGVDFKQAEKHFKSKIVLLFGIEPVSIGLPMSFPHFQVQSFANSTFLFIPAIEQLDKDDLLKSKLWVSLRLIFSI